MSSSPRVLDPVTSPGGVPVLDVSPSGDPAAWAAEHREGVRALVTDSGAVLIRGLGLRDVAGTGAVVTALADGAVTEREAFASRREYGPGLYSSTTWPQNQPMCMHHELSYRSEFPGLLLFACLTAPTSGGATGVADGTRVLEALPAGLVERFAREGWVLARSYNEEIGASIAESFGTDDPAAVERYCRAHDIEVEWQADGGLRTRQRRSAVVRHPRTGRPCWFNQIAFLNEWTIAPEIREYLVDVYGPDGLPFTTRYGNGDPIEEEVVAEINRVYEAHTAREPWQAGDLLVVDNVRSAHSREAFDGPRDVVVAMAENVHLTDCPPLVGTALR